MNQLACVAALKGGEGVGSEVKTKRGGGLVTGKGRKRLPQGPHIPPVNYNSRSSGERKFPLVDTSPMCHFHNARSHSGIARGFILTASALPEVTTQKNDS